MINRDKILKFLVFSAVLFNLGCSGSHAIHCIEVEGNEICFKREVWGFNGDRVWITENKNVCRKPSIETDYIFDTMSSGDSYTYKIEGNKLHIYPLYSHSLILPKKKFPAEIIPEPYNPGRDSLSENYQKVELGYNKMTSCLSDIF